MDTRTLVDELDVLLAVTVGSEGGFSDHREDKGGPTMYGISSRYNPTYAAEIRAKALTLDKAFEIYRSKYSPSAMVRDAQTLWTKWLALDSVVWGTYSVRSIQRALNELFSGHLRLDGVYGPKTAELWKRVKDRKQVFELGAILYKNAESDMMAHINATNNHTFRNGFLSRYKQRAGVMFIDPRAYFKVGETYSDVDMFRYKEKRVALDVQKEAEATYLAFASERVNPALAYREVLV